MTASPGAVPEGMRKLICPEAIEKSGAADSAPELSRTATPYPPSVSGNGDDAICGVGTRMEASKPVAIESGATARSNLAAERTLHDCAFAAGIADRITRG